MVRVGAGLGRVRGNFFGLMGGRTNSMLPVGILNTNEINIIHCDVMSVTVHHV